MEEKIKVGDYVQFGSGGNIEHGTVINVDASGYTVRPEDKQSNEVVGLGPGAVTKVQRR